MATPSQIRAQRKRNLRVVRGSLRNLDSELERLERRIKRILRVRKRFPDEDDAAAILSSIREMDSLLSKVSKAGISFSKIVRSF